MKCDLFERELAFAGTEEARRAHLERCPDCRAAAADFELSAGIAGFLHPPAPPAELAARLDEIPRRTVSCDGAAELLARRPDEALSEAEESRLAFHLGRCAACRETAEVLGLAGALVAPAGTVHPPMPGGGRLLAHRAGARPSRWTDPRLYAAAACLLAGIVSLLVQNLPQAGDVRVRVREASDRVELWQETLSRQVVAARAALTGYGRAAGAIVLSAAAHTAESVFFRADRSSEKKGRSL